MLTVVVLLIFVEESAAWPNGIVVTFDEGKVGFILNVTMHNSHPTAVPNRSTMINVMNMDG